MKLINPNIIKIDEKAPFKKIELAGRTCYKSEDKITEDSAIKFYSGLVKRHHTAMLEHATFVFETVQEVYDAAMKYRYLYATKNTEAEGGTRYIVSGNLRAINESGIAALIGAICLDGPGGGILAYTMFDHKEFKTTGGPQTRLIEYEDIINPSAEETSAHKWTTMRFVCDRGITHELVRHRPGSFAQESTRYVNYSKDENGGGDISFIKPAGYDEWSKDMQFILKTGLCEAETSYNRMIFAGATPQQARAVLPNAVKSEIVITANDGEWQHIFNLRSRGTTGAPHPDMKVVADMALNLYENSEEVSCDEK